MSDKKRVLIVDDSVMTCSIINGLFDSSDRFEVCATASNGQDALDQLADLEPDLIILDMEMPVMDGIAFLESARGLPVLINTKIVVFTTNEERLEPAKELGADLAMIKPQGLLYAYRTNSALLDKLSALFPD